MTTFDGLKIERANPVLWRGPVLHFMKLVGRAFVQTYEKAGLSKLEAIDEWLRVFPDIGSVWHQVNPTESFPDYEQLLKRLKPSRNPDKASQAKYQALINLMLADRRPRTLAEVKDMISTVVEVVCLQHLYVLPLRRGLSDFCYHKIGITTDPVPMGMRYPKLKMDLAAKGFQAAEKFRLFKPCGTSALIARQVENNALFLAQKACGKPPVLGRELFEIEGDLAIEVALTALTQARFLS